MFQRLPFYGQVLAMVLVALGVVGVAYFVWPGIQDDRAEIAKLESSLRQKQDQIREGRAIEARLPELEREIEGLERKLDDVAQILPTGPETGELLRWIKNLGDQSNLDLKSFAPGSMKPVEFYREFPIDMQIVGRYHDLGMFLDRISKYSRIINVDNLAMAALKSVPDKSISATFTATTFVYDDRREQGGEQ